MEIFPFDQCSAQLWQAHAWNSHKFCKEFEIISGFCVSRALLECSTRKFIPAVATFRTHVRNAKIRADSMMLASDGDSIPPVDFHFNIALVKGVFICRKLERSIRGAAENMITLIGRHSNRRFNHHCYRCEAISCSRAPMNALCQVLSALSTPSFSLLFE